MTILHKYFQENTSIPAWPYPIRYGDESRVDADMLVLGGGIAGCHAAINTRRRGAEVMVLEKAATKWNGNGHRLGMLYPPPANTRPPAK